MNYINKGKRDILIFPKFDNIERIQEIRKKYDELYFKIDPHITLAFPFKNEMTNEELKQKLENLLKDIKAFKIKCKGTTLIKDDKINTFYIFLNIIEGNDIIKNINNKIYSNILVGKKKNEFIPHITLGNTNNEKENIDFDYEFETIVDSIIVESIGENEESIIEFVIKL